jgi:hypothetical protein
VELEEAVAEEPVVVRVHPVPLEPLVLPDQLAVLEQLVLQEGQDKPEQPGKPESRVEQELLDLRECTDPRYLIYLIEQSALLM